MEKKYTQNCYFITMLKPPVFIDFKANKSKSHVNSKKKGDFVMTTSGIDIGVFKGTPLYALANNANVNGGKTLTASEFIIFEQQMKNLGMTFEEFGLRVAPPEQEGASAKETRKNHEQAGTELQKAYRSQFGKAGVQTAQTAETRADATVKTAYDMFRYEHKDTNFTPKSLGARPQFTDAQYKDNVTQYAVDLNTWANNVKTEYIEATRMSNEQLAQMVMNNDNKNTERLSDENSKYARAILEAVADGTAEVINEVQLSEKNVMKTIRDAEGHIVKIIQNAQDEIIGEVKYEGAWTRFNDDNNAKGIHHHIDYAEDEIIDADKKTTKRAVHEIKSHTTQLSKEEQKQAENLQKEIVKILKTQPTKESIALDILKGNGILLAKGALISVIGALGLPLVALKSLLDALR